MNKLIVRLLGLLGAGSISTGVGGAMADAGVDAWGIAATILGILFSLLVGGKWASNYKQLKKFVDELDKALEDDSITVEELRAMWAALRGK